jgi:hypothetical protein
MGTFPFFRIIFRTFPFPVLQLFMQPPVSLYLPSTLIGVLVSSYSSLLTVAFISAYAEQQDLLTYLEQYQLTFKEHFIKAWINAYRYYGVTTTSALEGLHSIVKRWLVTSTNDLLGVVNTLKMNSILESEMG